MSVSWNYDGAHSLTVTLTGAADGDHYMLSCDGGTDASDIAASGSVTLTISDVTNAAGFDLTAFLYHGDATQVQGTDPVVAANIFQQGTASTTGVSYDATWSYDGANSVQVTFTAASGITYAVLSLTGGAATTGGPYTAGTSQTITRTITAPAAGTPFYVWLYDNAYAVAGYSIRIFTSGTASAGSGGNPSGTVSSNTSSAVSVAVAFSGNALDAAPTFTDI